MEESVKIELRDGKKLFGILKHSENDDKLVIFVHGLTGHKNEHQFYNGAKVFAENDYSSFRLDLYAYQKEARELLECTVGTHSEDLNDVIDFFKDKYEAIYLVGHSIGGPTIIYAEHTNIRALGLWDSSFGMYENLKMYATFHNDLDKYVLNWGNDYLVSKDFVESLKKVNEQQIPFIDIPSVLVFAGKGELKDRWSKWLDKIPAEHEVVTLDEASHGFDEPGTEEMLFEATINWFNKY